MAATQHGISLKGPDVLGLPRPRLIPRIGGTSATRLGLVIAPPGTGKTTLLAQWAAHHSSTVAWFRATPRDATPGRVLAHFAAALAMAADEESPRSFAELELLAGRLEKPLVFVVDDLHALAHTCAESELERLLALNPPQVHFLVGSRRPPPFNLARSELPAAVTVSGEDLRFRANEVDQLFRNVYNQPLSPAGTLNLALRTDGWAAALHLFHLATKNRTHVERRRAAESLGAASQYVTNYLTHHYLAGVTEDMELLLRRSCLFDVLTPSRCDALLERRDSRQLIERLEQLGVVSSDDGGATARAPEVLRQHFIAAVAAAENTSPQGTRERTAVILEQEGAFGAALRVLAEGQDWDRVRSLLYRAGRTAVRPGTCEWAALVPGPLVQNDAAFAVARSRQLVDDGCVAAACGTAATVPALTSDPGWLELARDLQLTAACWAGDPPATGPPAAIALREAARGNPGGVARSMGAPGRPHDFLARGLAGLLAGDQCSALPQLRRCAGRLDDEPAAALAAQLALAVFGPESADVDVGGPAAELDAVQRQAQRRGFTWLARVAQGVHAGLPESSSSHEAVRTIIDSCDQRGDEWGAALVAASAALMQWRAGRPDVRAFDALAGRFRRLDAGSLEAWARSAQALVSATMDLPGATEESRSAEAFARAAGVPGALAVAYAAVAAQWPGHYNDLMQVARETGASAGLLCRPWTWMLPQPPATAVRCDGPNPGPAIGRSESADRSPGLPVVEVAECPALPALQIGCFGGFRLLADGVGVNLSRVRPQARTVLRILSLNAGRPVHRERLAGILWADLDTASALHALQVSVSSLRGALQPEGQADGKQLLVRHGEAYALVLGQGSVFDLADFDRTIHDASLARSAGDNNAAAEGLRRAVQLYTGDVLPEDGPAEWVGATRERYRLRAAEAAASLAGLELRLGNPDDAAAAATRSVEIDPWRDESWRTLVETFRRLGDPAAAERAQRRYDLILNSLGVPAASALSSPDVTAGRRTGLPRRTHVPPPEGSTPGS